MSFMNIIPMSSSLNTMKTIKKALEKSNSSEERKGQRTIIFQENDAFYDELDELVKTKKKVIIKFRSDKLDEDSPLIKRFTKCKNWDEIVEDIQFNSSVSSKFFKPQVVTSLTGGELLLIGLIVTLIFGVYVVYKERKLTIRVKKGDQEGEIIVE
ncbi:hypothetical protein FCV43_19475 [Vibrio genomosp. F6]|uniref:hypothetical protein n=1 Tax=Vibrio genomosp. F6 TaxID=723172 RepID=UPI0010BD2085|nr:hypothetical protein [Vibrio genomosp. F6]TKF14627.1 hypothetical protein FCV43_19475 [Vibrio genomosp. F6]